MKLLSTVLAGAMACGLVMVPAFAEDSAKQDMKDAGHNAKEAAKDTGRATKRTTKKAYHKTKRGVHKAADKVSDKTQ